MTPDTMATYPANVPARRVGFLGPGQMGRPMVERLLEKGFLVVTTTRRPEVADGLAVAGADVVATPAEVAEAAEVLVLCTFSDEQTREVMIGGGALAALPSGATIVSHVTGSPELGAELTAEAAVEVRYVDAPMSGTADGIRHGRLTLLIGADEADLERVRPAMESYADVIVHCGGVGDGQRVKLVNNLALAAQVVITQELVDVGERLGIDGIALTSALAHCSGASRAMAYGTEHGHEAFREHSRPFLGKDVAVVREVAAAEGVDLGLLGRLASWLDEVPSAHT